MSALFLTTTIALAIGSALTRPLFALLLLVIHSVLSRILILVSRAVNSSSWRGLVNRSLAIDTELRLHLARAV